MWFMHRWEAKLKPISQTVYETVKNMYWVLGSSHNEYADPFAWAFSVNEPRPVQNPTMHWRRPTYKEACMRQALYDANPKRFVETVTKQSEVFRKYRMPA